MEASRHPPRCDPKGLRGRVPPCMTCVFMPLHHRLDGPDDAPLLVLVPSLGTTLALWEPQIAALAGPYRLLRIDHRGHGDSPLPPAHATVEGFADDLRALLDELGVE